MSKLDDASDPVTLEETPSPLAAAAAAAAASLEQESPAAEGKSPETSPPQASASNVASAAPEKEPQEGLTIHDLLEEMVKRNASDLHITRGAPPHLRIDGKLKPMDLPPLRSFETETLCTSLLNQDQREHFETHKELDFAFGIRGLARFRASLFLQRNSISAAFRVIPVRIRSLEELGLPKVAGELARKPRGLILVTGSAGSGKSSTLAALIDLINRTRHHHIVTIEDPIEFVHNHQKCIINQREVGLDTPNFARAIRQVLRQDPDVIQIGEVRDAESAQATLSLAETGHLVLATLHTNSAVQSIHRVLDFFPHHQQAQARVQLSFVLEGVLCQQLLPRIGGGRALALEMMFPTPAMRHLIREDKLHQIYSQIQVGQLQNGMQTLNRSLADLYERGFIRKQDALARTNEHAELEQLLSQISPKETERASHPLLRTNR